LYKNTYSKSVRLAVDTVNLGLFCPFSKMKASSLIISPGKDVSCVPRCPLNQPGHHHYTHLVQPAWHTHNDDEVGLTHFCVCAKENPTENECERGRHTVSDRRTFGHTLL